MNDLHLTLIKIGIIVFLVIIFIVITIINMKTKKPEGCENDGKSCESCTISCIHKMDRQDE